MNKSKPTLPGLLSPKKVASAAVNPSPAAGQEPATAIPATPPQANAAGGIAATEPTTQTGGNVEKARRTPPDCSLAHGGDTVATRHRIATRSNLGNVSAIPEPCGVCGFAAFWLDIYFMHLHCGGCKPPVSRAMVKQVLFVVLVPDGKGGRVSAWQPADADRKPAEDPVTDIIGGWYVRPDGVISNRKFTRSDPPTMSPIGVDFEDWWAQHRPIDELIRSNAARAGTLARLKVWRKRLAGGVTVGGAATRKRKSP